MPEVNAVRDLLGSAAKFSVACKSHFLVAFYIICSLSCLQPVFFTENSSLFSSPKRTPLVINHGYFSTFQIAWNFPLPCRNCVYFYGAKHVICSVGINSFDIANVVNFLLMLRNFPVPTTV